MRLAWLAGTAVTRKTVVAPGPVLGHRVLNRAFMARKLMIRPSQIGSVEAMEHLVGLQGQVPLVPYTSLWSRLDGFEGEFA